ncbi:MAG: FAD-dependent oxidoreductase [Calditrichaeota bacterium]|nr:MAG: FAD-dependent oxidoreductase [Calditrichota bacterium]
MISTIPSYSTSVTQIRMIADHSCEILLQKPKSFQFQAGQHLYLKLNKLLYDDRKGQRRTFTIASAPFESELRLATRLTGSGFKRTLMEMTDSQVEIMGPKGEMVLDTSFPAIFIAGGIGITPFRSMVLEGLKMTTISSMTLLYSNPRLETAVYHDLFTELASFHSKRFYYYPTLTAQADQDASWRGERRRLDHVFIRDYVPPLGQVKYYLCGPQTLVQTLMDSLLHENVRAENIRSEIFWGY